MHQVRTMQDAGFNAARWMQHWGFADAAVTAGGADGGMNVRATYALAQVTFQASPVGRPDLQRLIGAAAAEQGRQLLFFTGSNYSAEVVPFADAAGIALFTFGLDGSMTPMNVVAGQLVHRRAAATPVPTWQPTPSTAWQVAPVQAAAPALGDRFKAGGWYFVVPILSVGIFAAVPFWHAAVRLGRPALWRPALSYSAAGLVLLVMNGLIPKDASGEPVGWIAATAENLFVALALLVMLAACLQLRPIKREVFGGPVPAPPGRAATSAPTVAQAHERRARRADARTYVENDRGLARELGIGRPDLGRGYDDGGLVDVNAASAETLAQVCGMDLRDAQRVVDARVQRGGWFYSVGDIFMEVALPPGAEDELRERGLVL